MIAAPGILLVLALSIGSATAWGDVAALCVLALFFQAAWSSER